MERAAARPSTATHGALRLRPAAASAGRRCRSRSAASASSGRVPHRRRSRWRSRRPARCWPKRTARLRVDRNVERAIQPMAAALGRGSPHAGRRHAARRRIPMPACRGSARRSAATASSPRCRCCGSIRASRAACSRISRRRRPTASTRRRTPSRARSCTRPAAARWRRLGEVPFGRYYGSVDATPLFVILAGAYFDRTGDRAFIAQLWPHVERALAWIDRYGDRDGDGFVEYAPALADGLVQQGWKDSQDSIFHADGALAERADRALRSAGVRLRRAAPGRGAGRRTRQARRAPTRCDEQADQLRAAFEERFWCEEESHLRDRAGRRASSRAASAVRTRATVSSAGIAVAGSRAARGRAARRSGDVFRVGHPHDRAAPRRATTRCRTTTDRCGRTTTASSLRVWRVRLRRSDAGIRSPASSTRARTSRCTGFRSSSAGFIAERGKVRHSIRSPARRRRGPRASYSSCFSPASASRSMRRRGVSASIARRSRRF